MFDRKKQQRPDPQAAWWLWLSNIGASHALPVQPDPEKPRVTRP